MTTLRAVAKMQVELLIGDAENLRAAEKMIDQWLSSAEEDDRLIQYRVVSSDWAPYAPPEDSDEYGEKAERFGPWDED